MLELSKLKTFSEYDFLLLYFATIVKNKLTPIISKKDLEANLFHFCSDESYRHLFKDLLIVQRIDGNNLVRLDTGFQKAMIFGDINIINGVSDSVRYTINILEKEVPGILKKYSKEQIDAMNKLVSEMSLLEKEQMDVIHTDKPFVVKDEKADEFLSIKTDPKAEEEFSKKAQEIRSQISKTEILSSDNIGDLLEEGDLVEIEYYLPLTNTPKTRLFEVDLVLNGRVSLMCAHMSFLMVDNAFLEANEYKPVIKSIIKKDDLKEVEHKVVKPPIKKIEKKD